MKKMICALLAVVLLTCCFSGCNTTVQTNIPSDITEKIIQDYWDTYCSQYEDTDLPIPIEWLSLRSYGVFNNVYVLFLDGAFGYTYGEKTDTIAGVKFHYPSTQELLVYHDGAFRSLQEVYDAGLLTVRELRKLPREFPENGFLELDQEKKDEIAEAYYDKYRVHLLDEQWTTAEDVGQRAGGMVYLGSNNGYDILFESTMADVLSSERIADQTFLASSSFVLYAYKDGTFYSLEDTYDKGFVSKDAIIAAARVNRMYYLASWQKKYYHWYDWN